MYRLTSFWHVSSVLAHNPLSDPARRRTWVLTPDDYPDDAPLPSIWMLASFMSTGSAFLSFRPWQENFMDRVSRLRKSGALLPVRFVLPDVFTAVGGSQFIDSPAIGRYQTYLWHELLPAVEARYATGRRGLAGTSSGGYGAIITALLGPPLFSGVAAHAADMGFSWCYLSEFPKLLDVLRTCGGLEAFWHRFQNAVQKPPSWLSAINLMAMAMAYSPNLNAPPPHADLPLDPFTLEIQPRVWTRWLQWDPLSLIDRSEIQDRVRQLQYFYFDAGLSDQYHLQYGAERFHRKLSNYAIEHDFAPFEGDHFGTQSRFDLSLPRLAEALSV